MTTDYSDLLNRSRKDIPKPALLPEGMWRLRAQRAQFFEPRQEDQNPRVVVWYKAVEPLSDVDPDALAALPADYDFANTPLEANFWLGELKDWDKLNAHLDMLGVDSSLTVVDALKAVTGREVNAYLDQDTYTPKNGEPETKNVPKNFISAD